MLQFAQMPYQGQQSQQDRVSKLEGSLA